MRHPFSLILRALATAALIIPSACDRDVASPPVVPPAPEPQHVEVAFCGAPMWVAFQDGDGSWTRATPTTSGAVATFGQTFSNERAGIAVARKAGDLVFVTVQFALANELPIVSDTAGTNCGASATKKIFGNVVGVDTNEVARVSIDRGVGVAFISAGTGPAFDIENVVSGPHDLLATRLARAPGGNGSVVNGIIIRRLPDLPDGTTIAALDFNSAEAFQPVAHKATLDGSAQSAIGFSGVRTAAGTEDILGFFTDITSPSGATYFAVPEAKLQPGDLQSLALTAVTSQTVSRASLMYFRVATDRTLSLGALPSAPAFDMESRTPTLRVRARFAAQADYDRNTSISYQQGVDRIVSVGMTGGYATRNASGYDLRIPEFSGVDGFDARWALQPGTELRWTTARIGGTLALGFDPRPTDGSMRRSATDTGIITP